MICPECGGRRYRKNPANLVGLITGDEFKREMVRQDVEGKHGDYDYPFLPTDWDVVVQYAEKKAIGLPFAHVSGLPLKFLILEHDPDVLRRVEEYSQRTSPYPPIFVSLTSYAIKQAKIDGKPVKIKVRNGNHRVAAARFRGDSSIDAYMNLETLRNIRLEFESDILI